MNESLTVITICFNNRDELIRSCASVDVQDLLPDEHLIIDGSSNKEILNWLEKEPQPHYRKWLHERDNGISDAFNKGIKNAKGSIIQFLNSGDIFFDNSVLQKVQTAFDMHKDIQWCHGKMQLQRSNNTVVIGKPFEKKKLYRGMRSVFHPTIFARKELFEKYGGFDTSLTIAMDYDFLIRISNEKFMFIPEPLISFDPHGISNTKYIKSLKETRRCYEKYNGKSGKLWIWQLRLKFLHYLLKSPAGPMLYKMKMKFNLENY